MLEWIISPIGTDVVVKLLLAVLTAVVTALTGAFRAWVKAQRKQHDEDRREREERDAALITRSWRAGARPRWTRRS